ALWERPAPLPRWPPRRAAPLQPPRFHRRLGTHFLWGHGLRGGHGLHPVPALSSKRTLRDPSRPRTRHDRLGGHLRPGGPFRRRGHGRRVLDLRTLRPACPQRDGRHPGHRRRPGRPGGPPGPAAGHPPPWSSPHLAMSSLARTRHPTCPFLRLTDTDTAFTRRRVRRIPYETRLVDDSLPIRWPGT